MTKRHRIGIDARPALWDTTGIGTIVLSVIARIQKMDPDNDYYFYFDRNPSRLQPLIDPARCFYHERRNEMLWANLYVPRRVFHDKLDVFLSFLEREIPFITRSARIVCMVHDLIPLRFPESVFRSRLHRVYYETTIRAATARADVVLTNSEYSKREIIDLLRLPENKVRKIRLGGGAAPSDDFDPAADRQTLASLGLDGEYFVALGSTEPRKNNQRVVEAFQVLCKGHPSLKLAIVGKPWRGRAFPLSLLNSQVVLTGYLPAGVLTKVLRNAIALVFPSLHEGFGFPVLEAMACGTPVITSATTALPEVGGDAALYVDPYDPAAIRNAMHSVLTDPALRGQLAACGRERAAHFRWENTCADLKNILADVAGEPARNDAPTDVADSVARR